MQHNLSALFLYLAIVVGADTLKLLVDVVWIEPAREQLGKGLVQAYGFGSLLLLSVCFALGQSVAFARMGREMDRPLWKVSGDREAIRRYVNIFLERAAQLRL